eukprot:CAMPEP_0181123776 /NCGR_PEP_ID=MMETSP1071-20121207/26099_1 /TAXON_ID=35127 /ORGANISM="Thalassiosira sp., Strain NH16" /LENGTH=70 /DNA_ID=CAMNT_0023208979 /DNA_START=356 /DNA_END=564 /DNA_ORIENTATION=+
MSFDHLIRKKQRKMEFDQLIRMEEIALGFRNLHDGDLDVLVDVLQKSTVLQVLHLYWNQITFADGKFTKA